MAEFADNPLNSKKLRFNQGSNYFRQRLVLSLLSSRAVKIEEIRSKSDLNVGVTPYEVSFINLLNIISNGSRFRISETGTTVNFVPGALTGGVQSHSCDKSRPLSYYLEPILLLAPFCKKPLQLTLKGRLQNDLEGYTSVYKIKHAALPILEIFGLELDLQVTSRSYDESEVKFTCTVKKQLLTLRNQLNQGCGKVKKVRGLAYGFRVSPQMLNRIVTSAKGTFLPFLSDVFITSDPVKHSKSKMPGFGLVMYAETTKNITYAVDGFVGRENSQDATKILQPFTVTSDLSHKSELQQQQKRKFDIFADDEDDDGDGNGGDEKLAKRKKKKIESSSEGIIDGKTDVKKSNEVIVSPEEFGSNIAKQLIKEIATKSCVDSVYQWLVLSLMALGPKDVTSVLLGPLTPFTIQYLRDLKLFFNVTFRIEKYREDDEDNEEQRKTNLHKLSCLGVGYINLNKTMT